VSKKGAGIHVEPKILLRTGQSTFSQPLPAVDAKDPGDAAKTIEREISDALKGMKPYNDCVNDLRAQKWDQAVKDAQLGITAYPNTSLSRMCMLQALVSQKASPDSIISVSNATLAIDPTAIVALGYLADAYRAKGDTSKAIETNLRIYRADPSNASVAQGIVNDLAQSGAPDRALPIIDSLLVQNPGDPQMLRTKWLLQLRAKQYKQAIATGAEIVKLDTSFATVDYFNRMIGAAQSDSNAAAVQQLAAQASTKFPKEISYPMLQAQSAFKSGQLQQAIQAAQRASQIDPKAPAPWQFILAAQSQMNMPDSMLATAQKAIAAGVPKDSIGGSLLAVVGPALKKAQETKAREDWEAALKSAQTVDAIVPTAQTAFYVGVSSFNIGQDAVNNIQKLYKGSKDDKAKACAEAKAAEDAFTNVSISMPKGGSVNKEAAGQMMGALPSMNEFLSQVKAALKCK
jgi:tetratricopeptide (TPR) repeat protein